MTATAAPIEPPTLGPDSVTLPDTPMATPRHGDPIAAQSDKDAPHDPAIHESPPRKRKDGGWAMKRGNGARAAAGKSFFVPPPRTAAADPAAPAVSSDSPGQSGAVDAVPVAAGDVPAMAPLDEAACRATATAVTDGAFGLARMFRGEVWEPDREERAAWIDCLSRMWQVYALPRVGPAVEAIMLLVGSIARRKTESRKLIDWVLNRKPAEPIAAPK